MTNVINVLCYLAGTSWLVFVIAYHLRARWWESPTGRNVMGTAGGIAGILAVTVVARIAPDWSLRPVLQTVTFTALILLGAQRTHQMLRAQRDPNLSKEPIMNREPAAVIGAITAAVAAVLGLLGAFGLPITEEQQSAILAAIGPVVALIMGAAFLIRSKVYAPVTVERIAADAHKDGREEATTVEVQPTYPTRREYHGEA